MTQFLLRTFIKDYQNTSDRGVRQHYGSFAGTVGICCNLFLFAVKLIAGFLSQSISVISDAFNNLSDAGSSLITLFGFRIASAPADKEHPYGHGRIEYVTGLTIAAVILIVGLYLATSSIEKIIGGEAVSYSPLAFAILLLSVSLKTWMWRFYLRLGNQIDSVALRAAASDSRSDCVATLVVVIGMLIEHTTGILVDGWFGLFVSGFILYSGYQSARDSMSPLIGKAPDKEMEDYIKTVTEHIEACHGFHHLIAHNYGPGNWMITFDMVLDEDLTLKQAHTIITAVEQQIEKRFACLCSIHPDPYNDEHEDSSFSDPGQSDSRKITSSVPLSTDSKSSFSPKSMGQ